MKDINGINTEGVDMEDIKSVLNKWNEVVIVRKQIADYETSLKARVKSYMKERKWTSYMEPETKIHISIDIRKRETIDKIKVCMLLTAAQLAQVTKVTTYEQMSITSKEDRKRVGNYVK